MSFSFISIVMIFASKFLILLFVAHSCGALMFPLDNHVLNTPCEGKNLVKGMHRLLDECSAAATETVGFIKSVGFVVCCVEPSGNVRRVDSRVGDRSRTYCKAHGVKKQFILDFHIVGGERSDVAEFPHMVALGYDNLGEIDFDCGGSIISERFVLTAAHCANRKTKQPTVVRMGRTSLDLDDADDNSLVHDVNVKRIIFPKEYSAAKKYHDVALIELEDTLTFRDNVGPICLQADNDDPAQGRNFTIIGFGTSDLKTRAKSDWLLKATVQEMPSRECQAQYQNIQLRDLPDGVTSFQVCARDEKKTPSDTCPGDSGSPLQLTSLDNKYLLVGITSFGLGCGSSFPSVYTRINQYIEWIESIVWPGIN